MTTSPNMSKEPQADYLKIARQASKRLSAKSEDPIEEVAATIAEIEVNGDNILKQVKQQLGLD